MFRPAIHRDTIFGSVTPLRYAVILCPRCCWRNSAISLIGSRAASSLTCSGAITSDTGQTTSSIETLPDFPELVEKSYPLFEPCSLEAWAVHGFAGAAHGGPAPARRNP